MKVSLEDSDKVRSIAETAETRQLAGRDINLAKYAVGKQHALLDKPLVGRHTHTLAETSLERR